MTSHAFLIEVFVVINISSLEVVRINKETSWKPYASRVGQVQPLFEVRDSHY